MIWIWKNESHEMWSVPVCSSIRERRRMPSPRGQPVFGLPSNLAAVYSFLGSFDDTDG